MDGLPETQSWLQWICGIAISATIGAFSHVYIRMSGMAKDAREGDDKLWLAHDDERKTNGAFREKISERLGSLPTKDDLAKVDQRIINMEERIMNAFRGRP